MSKEATVATPKKPISMQLIGPAYSIWNEMSVHMRDSFIINPSLGIEICPNGNAIVNLVMGNPDTAAIERAKESTALAIRQEQAAYDRAVREEAKRLTELAKREELQKQITALKAEQEQKIRELQKATEAAIAKLN